MKGNFHVPFLGEGARATGLLLPDQTLTGPKSYSEAEMKHFLKDDIPSGQVNTGMILTGARYYFKQFYYDHVSNLFTQFHYQSKTQ